MAEITGKTLVDWGFAPGKWFAQALREANAMDAPIDDIRAHVATLQLPPTLPLKDPPQAYGWNIEAQSDDERENLAQVKRDVDAIMRTPTVVDGAVMPDACPTGGMPVGTVAVTENAIHPGWHSADICCSVAISVLGNVDPKKALDAGQTITHFGPTGRDDLAPPTDLLAAMTENLFLQPFAPVATSHFGTQGDGNHFFYVGRLRSTGQTAIVTHHGSRRPGALLYKAGMKIAERFRQALSPQTPKGNAWIPADTAEGEAYWAALQLIRAWTKANHEVLHDLTAQALGVKIVERFWNEHNFVFRRDDGRFYHAKGATPAYRGFAVDDSGLTLIPLNMAQPILIARGLDNPDAVGFAPHGAGRNMSRTRFLRENDPKMPDGIDARFYCGIPDLSELPEAYKDAGQVRAQIERFGLAEIVDEVEPYGSIMAGDWQRPFREARRKRRQKRVAKGD